MPPEHFMDAKLKCVFEMPEGHREEAAATAVKALKTEATLPQKVKNEEKVNVEFVKRKGSISIVFNCCDLCFQIINLDNTDHTEWQANEIRQLREENSNLRKELLKIKV